MKNAEKLKSHASQSTTGQNFQSGQVVSSRLRLTTQSSHEAKSPDHSVCQKPGLSHSKHTPVYIPLIPAYCRELLKRNLREKPQRKTKLTHPQSLHFDSPNSSTLTLFIVTSLRGTLAKPFSHHTQICEKVIWCLGSSQERTD